MNYFPCLQHASYFLSANFSADFLTLSDLLLFPVLLISYTLVTQVNPSANNSKPSTNAFPPYANANSHTQIHPTAAPAPAKKYHMPTTTFHQARFSG